MTCRSPIATHFSQHLYHHRSASAMSAATLFLARPLPLLLGGLLGKGEAGHLALHLWPTHQQWEHCLRWWRNCSENRYKRPACPNLLLLHLLVILFWQTPCWLLQELQILVKNRWTGLVVTQSPWASFTLVILHFGSNGCLYIEVPLDCHCCHQFPLFCLSNYRSHLCSRQGLTFLTISWIFLSIFWLWRAVADTMGQGQPTCQEEWKMCRKRRRIVMPMWCIYMSAHMSCSVVVMFICTLVRSHPDSRRR